MKLWQLLACLDNEQNLFFDLYGNVDLVKEVQTEVEDFVLSNILGQSEKKICVTTDQHLRLYDGFTKQHHKIEDILTMLDAFKKYGGEALAEVMDYGSFNLKKSTTPPSE